MTSFVYHASAAGQITRICGAALVEDVITFLADQDRLESLDKAGWFILQIMRDGVEAEPPSGALLVSVCRYATSHQIRPGGWTCGAPLFPII